MRRNLISILLLCDKKSDSGQRFIKKIRAIYKFSEFEMYLQKDCSQPCEEQICGVTFKKAVNADALEIARQNAIYFDDHSQDKDPNLEETGFDTVIETRVQDDGMLLPEEEERRGMTIYLAEKDKQVVGKVHLQINSTVGGIYGLGVLPEYRGKGLGRAILLKAIKNLREANIKTIMLQVAAENATALSLYKSCGFMETSTMDYFELHTQSCWGYISNFGN